MILVKKSPNADSRTMKGMVGKEELKRSTQSHINDVYNGIDLIAQMMLVRAYNHDHTKMELMNEFHEALTGGHIIDSPWYQHHITAERHHLKRHVPSDVNLIDVLEHVVDCTMAGLARSGEDANIFDLDIDPEVLKLAIQNTSKLIRENSKVID